MTIRSQGGIERLFVCFNLHQKYEIEFLKKVEFSTIDFYNTNIGIYQIAMNLANNKKKPK